MDTRLERIFLPGKTRSGGFPKIGYDGPVTLGVLM